ncbi:hypothetical protein PORY_000116 [Pneumocystis oryctolagi]|uniref:Uncharacterized protein n=1 Tax=Pneumocystis oryctolagi TaxID=42067 RepID=A0ACB7CGF4_9ASCO|nr:hypothetical protein PORY_000116 [Pneumocystis oryctolagi]
MEKEECCLDESLRIEKTIDLTSSLEFSPQKNESIDNQCCEEIYNENKSISLDENEIGGDMKRFSGVLNILDQEAFEKDVFLKADYEAIERSLSNDCKRLQRLNKEKIKLLKKIEKIEEKAYSLSPFDLNMVDQQKISDLNNQLFLVQEDIRDVSKRVENLSSRKDKYKQGLTSSECFKETDREYLIRIGKITPFSKISGLERQVDVETLDESLSVDSTFQEKNISQNGISDHKVRVDNVSQDELIQEKHCLKDNDKIKSSEDFGDFSVNNNDEYSEEDRQINEYQDFSCIDDGDEKYYQELISGLRNWVSGRKHERMKYNTVRQESEIFNEVEEWFCPHPTIKDCKYEGGYSLPGDIHSKLFNYQKTCIQWLWELYCQSTGGIIADEMGLGKTIQIVGFLGGLHYSRKLSGPIMIVCPATIMKQWVIEFHKWWPPFRVAILHITGSGLVNKHQELEKKIENNKFSKNTISHKLKIIRSIKKIIEKITTLGHVLIITYSGLRIYREYLFENKWAYCVLDEGHKIRNPESDISFICKQIKTPHRIILSGTPIQNNLDELWCLFDFISPGHLGTLPVFQSQFSVPLNIGGYANATNIQVQTAYKCACVLRDLISPYLLRRMKADVAADLPNKSEQVLFCKLTKFQKEAYKSFLNSKDMDLILKGEKQVLYGIDILRKICNHPDLVYRETFLKNNNTEYGDSRKSGKMQVVKEILKLWKSQGHRTLLFAQTKQMLDILEKSIKKMDQFNYFRMDGGTSISSRQSLVDKFNNSNDIDIFLLTTRVGGLGVNLTGANRVIIYDPDWNPSTDVQARERSWRLGQKKEVIIYRLMTSGTIEEKIYHRQIFKQFLTNKILKDPKQRRFFKTTDLYDLFSLKSDDIGGTETGEMFIGTERICGKIKPLLTTSKNQNMNDNYKLKMVPGVTGVEDFTVDNTLSKKKDNEFQILEDIFAKSGVCSTLQHDMIMDSSHQEVSLIEKEATRISEEALKVLKASRKEIRKSGIGTSTWTEKSKESSEINFTEDRNFTSSLLLNSKVTDKHERKLSSAQNLLDQVLNDRSIRLIKKICEFIIMKGGKASSADIVERFGTSVNGSQQVIEFRKILKKIAKWENKFWVLKEEFL